MELDPKRQSRAKVGGSGEAGTVTTLAEGELKPEPGRGKGLGFVLLAAGLSGISTPLAKALVGTLSPLLLAGLLYFGSGLGAGLLAVTTPKGMTRNETSLTRADIPWVLGTIGFGGVLGPLLYLYGLQRLWASDASLLLNLEAIFTILLACIVFSERINRRFAFGACAIVLGSVIISLKGIQAAYDLVGTLAIIGACFCWGFDNNFIRKIAHRSPFQVAGIKGLVAGVIDLLIALPFVLGSPMLAIVGALVVGVFSYGFCNVFWSLGLRYLGSARAGAYYSSAPFIGAIISVVLLHEGVTVYLVAASLAMAVGVWLAWTEKR
jgi:drug/metabolite transporter (DMT)-like permease